MRERLEKGEKGRLDRVSGTIGRGRKGTEGHEKRKREWWNMKSTGDHMKGKKDNGREERDRRRKVD